MCSFIKNTKYPTGGGGDYRFQGLNPTIQRVYYQ